MLVEDLGKESVQLQGISRYSKLAAEVFLNVCGMAALDHVSLLAWDSSRLSEF